MLSIHEMSISYDRWYCTFEYIDADFVLLIECFVSTSFHNLSLFWFVLLNKCFVIILLNSFLHILRIISNIRSFILSQFSCLFYLFKPSEYGKNLVLYLPFIYHQHPYYFSHLFRSIHPQERECYQRHQSVSMYTTFSC